MKRPSLAQALLLIAAFLAPIVGGQVATESQPLAPGLASLLVALFEGSVVPFLSHALVAIATSAAFVVLAVRRHVFQIPSLRVTGSVLAFFGLLVLSMAMTEFRSISAAALAEWLAYGLAFFTVVACIGRKTGPIALIGAIVAGCTLIALMGLAEFGRTMVIDPSWRIFSTWTPNSLAGILGIGFLLAAGLAWTLKGTGSAAAGVSAIVQGAALGLTQSKGGILAALIGFLVLALLSVIWTRRSAPVATRRILVGAVAIPVIAVIALQVVGAIARNAHKEHLAQVASASSTNAQPGPASGSSAPASAKSRLGSAEQTQEQSAGFRRLLWQGAGQLIAGNPLGYGIGVYRFVSTKPGLTPQTHLTHNTYLQLAVEGGALALAALLLFAAFWTFEVFKGARSGDAQQALLRAAVVAAVVASAIHNAIDSDLYTFGIGWVFFALLGVGLLLSSDAVAPEYTPGSARVLGAIAAIGVALSLTHSGVLEQLRSTTRYERDVARSFLSAKETIDRAIAFGSGDGENWRLAASLAPTEFDRGAALKMAAELHPNVRNLRAYAQHLAAQGDLPRAIGEYEKALSRDPNNLLTLLQLSQAQAQYGELDGALATARRLIEVETKPYFQVRALPHIVPTETFDARVFVAQNTPDMSVKIGLLEGAVSGYTDYLQKTVPSLRQMAVAFGDPSAMQAGESLDLARYKMRNAAFAARALADAHRTVGRPGDATAADAKADAFLAVASESDR